MSCLSPRFMAPSMFFLAFQSLTALSTADPLPSEEDEEEDEDEDDDDD